MTEREIEPIMEKLREAEALVLAILKDDERSEDWVAASDAKGAIWRALDKTANLAR